MKRTILLMAMALMVNVAFGQTVNKLIEKYRQLPNAQYMDTSKETLKFYDENPDPALTEKERAQLKKNFKMSETVQLEKVDEEQLAQLEEDIKALKGYEMLFVTNKNGGSDEDANVLRQMMSEVFNPTIKLQCYGKVKGNKVSDLLMKLKAWETVVLMHIDTKVEKELVVKSIMEKEAVSFESDDNEVDIQWAAHEIDTLLQPWLKIMSDFYRTDLLIRYRFRMRGITTLSSRSSKASTASGLEYKALHHSQ